LRDERAVKRELRRQLALVPQLAEIGAATARYRNVSAAVVAGYVEGPVCFRDAGLHYVDWRLVGDGTVDPLRPEALIYDGSEKLVGIEYFEYARFSRPSLFGKPFEGPATVPDVAPEPFFIGICGSGRRIPTASSRSSIRRSGASANKRKEGSLECASFSRWLRWSPRHGETRRPARLHRGIRSSPVFTDRPRP
jgi:hypothetical protein